MDNNGVYGIPQSAVNEIFVTGKNDWGTTNTNIARFNNLVTNLGSAIEYVDDVANGAVFRIKVPGFYAVTYWAEADASPAGNSICITYNQDDNTEGATTPDAKRIAYAFIDNTAVSATLATVTGIKYCYPGDRIRAVGEGAAVASTDAGFRISKIG